MQSDNLKKMKDQPLILEQEFNSPIELVWRAITEKELMEKWYFVIDDFKLEVGNTFHFEGGNEDRRYTHICEIIEIIPLQKLKYSWKYKGHIGVSFVTFELFPIGKKIKLKLTHEGLDSFPKDNPDLIQENFVGGWKHLIQESLKEFLENGKALRYW